MLRPPSAGVVFRVHGYGNAQTTKQARRIVREMIEQNELPEVIAVDGVDRIADFFARHGGPGLIHEMEGNSEEHTLGWSEVFAADGYKLRCDWSTAGTKTEMSFLEIPPLK